MRRGRLRHLLTIEQDTPTQSGSGHPVRSWGTFVTLWGGVEPIKGSERFGADQVTAEITHRVVTEYRAGITAKMRVKYEPGGGVTRYLQIESVIDPNERNRWLELMCKEVNP